jgi:hypothetical protein
VLFLGVAPPLAGAFLGATSAALGVLLSALTIVVLSINYNTFKLNFNKKSLLIFIFILLYSSIQQLFVGFLDIRAYASIIIFLFLLYSAKNVGYWLFLKMRREHFEQVVIFTCISFIFIVIFNYFYEFKFAKEIYKAHRSIFPFGEPSHFALYAAPFFVMWGLIIKSIWKKILLLFCMFLMTFFIESLTFFIYAFLSAFVTFIKYKSKLLKFIATFCVAIFVFLAANNVYYSERVIISSDSNNLSSLVYLQGIQDAWNSLSLSHGLGLGFQMLGTQPVSEASILIAAILNVEPDLAINRLDGGFLSAKIIAEFGLLGLLFIILYIRKVIQSIIFIYKEPQNSLDILQFAFNVFFMCSIVEFFFRGIGYFSPSIFILLIFYFSSSFKDIKKT